MAEPRTDADITPAAPDWRIPLDDDWISPTIGKLPPAGLAPGEMPTARPYPGERVEPVVEPAAKPGDAFIAPAGTPAPNTTSELRAAWSHVGRVGHIEGVVIDENLARRMLGLPPRIPPEVTELAPVPRGWLWRALDRVLGGGR